MKQILLILVVVFSFCSCTDNTWHKDTTKLFYEGCTGEAIKWAGSEEVAKTYCDCVLGKMQQKYPNENDALEHIDILATDTGLINCKEEVLNSMTK